MKVLVSGFDAFNLDTINSSSLVLDLIPDQIANFEVIKVLLPTKYKKASEILIDVINKEKPDFVLPIGQASKRCQVTMEKVAINIMDASIGDNAKILKNDEKIKIDGDFTYVSNLELDNFKDLIKISYHAGTFVCNNVFYDLLYLVNKKGYKFKSSFIHIPNLKRQIKNPKDCYMDIEKIADVIIEIIKRLK